MGLKAIKIHSSSISFRIKLDVIFKSLPTNHFEKIEIDCTVPYVPRLPPYQFISTGSLDDWKDTLKIFRYRGGRLDESLRNYLDKILEKCNFVDIKEISAALDR